MHFQALLSFLESIEEEADGQVLPEISCRTASCLMYTVHLGVRLENVMVQQSENRTRI